MRAIHHQGLGQILFDQLQARFLQADGIIIRSFAPPQYDMDPWVAVGLDDTGFAFLIDSQKTLRGAGGHQCIDGR